MTLFLTQHGTFLLQHSKLFDESIAAAKLERLYNSVKPDVLERFKTMVEGKSSEASQTFLEELKKNIEVFYNCFFSKPFNKTLTNLKSFAKYCYGKVIFIL